MSCQKWFIWKKNLHDLKIWNNIIRRVLQNKNIIFYFKKLKLTKNNTFNNVFCNRIYFYNRFLPIFKNEWNFIKRGLFSQGNFLYNSTVFNFENKLKNFKHRGEAAKLAHLIESASLKRKYMTKNYDLWYIYDIW